MSLSNDIKGADVVQRTTSCRTMERSFPALASESTRPVHVYSQSNLGPLASRPVRKRSTLQRVFEANNSSGWQNLAGQFVSNAPQSSA